MDDQDEFSKLPQVVIPVTWSDLMDCMGFDTVPDNINIAEAVKFFSEVFNRLSLQGCELFVHNSVFKGHAFLFSQIRHFSVSKSKA